VAGEPVLTNRSATAHGRRSDQRRVHVTVTASETARSRRLLFSIASRRHADGGASTQAVGRIQVLAGPRAPPAKKHFAAAQLARSSARVQAARGATKVADEEVEYKSDREMAVAIAALELKSKRRLAHRARAMSCCDRCPIAAGKNNRSR